MRMYAMRYHEGFVLLSEDGLHALDPDVRSGVVEDEVRPGYAGYLNLSSWVETKLGAFPPPTAPVLRELASRVMATIPPGDSILELRNPPEPFAGVRLITFYELKEPGGLSPIGSERRQIRRRH